MASTPTTLARPGLPGFERFAPPARGGVDLLFVAGEHSGDEHAARLAQGILARRRGLRICAIGGQRLAAAGAQVLHDPTGVASIGYADVIRRYASYYRPFFRETVRWISEHRPAAICLVDYGGFNLRLASALREAGLSAKGGGAIRVLYYISPQVWASRAGRRFKLARSVDAMAVIFPFEPAAYADTGLPVEFVGHPFAAPDYSPPVAYDPSGPILLLPGSRRKPVQRIFPSFLEAYRSAGIDRRAVVIYPSDEIAGVLRDCLGQGSTGVPGSTGILPVPSIAHGRRSAKREDGGTAGVVPKEWPRREPFGAAEGTNAGAPRVDLVRGGGAVPVPASAVLTSSGTMSVHCALAGIPGAVAYRADGLTYLLGRWLVKVPYLGLANLLLGEPMYPEYIQGAATPSALAAELRSCVSDPARAGRTRELAGRLRTLLGKPSGATAVDWLERKLEPSGRAG